MRYGSISNNAKLASCHERIGDFRQAVEAARKANNLIVWKKVKEIGDLEAAIIAANDYIAGLTDEIKTLGKEIKALDKAVPRQLGPERGERRVQRVARK